jgi:hypothetical protein
MYGLSQTTFSRWLGWGDITVHRYESGSPQDSAHNETLMLLPIIYVRCGRPACPYYYPFNYRILAQSVVAGFGDSACAKEIAACRV